MGGYKGKMNTDKSKFKFTSDGAYLHNLREKRGLSQKELGYVVGIDNTNICQMELGKRPIPHKHMPGLARALRVSLTDFRKALDDRKKHETEKRERAQARLARAKAKKEKAHRKKIKAKTVVRQERSKRPQLNVRVEGVIKDILNDICDATGKTQSEVVSHALRCFGQTYARVVDLLTVN